MINAEFLSKLRRGNYISNAMKRYLKFELWIFVLFSGVLLNTSNSVYSQTVDDNFYIADSTVWCSVVLNNTLYIGGDFQNVAPFTGRGVALNTTTGVYDNTMPKVNGEVYAVIPDGSGGWYIGGNFTKVGSYDRDNLAHIKSNKTVDGDWNPSTNRPVFALAISNNIVYVGGSFYLVTGTNGTTGRMRLASFDATSGAFTSWDPYADGYVYALAVSGDNVYAGGAFTKLDYGNVDRNRLASIDATTGNITDWDPNVNNTVLALAITDTIVYAGGTFTSVNGSTTRNRLAAFYTSSSTVNVKDWNPNVNDTVRTIAFNSDIFIGGAFTSIGSTTRNKLAAIDTSTGDATAWDPNVNRTVFSMAISGTTVYAGGTFDTVNSSTVRKRIAAFDITSGTVTSWDPKANNTVYSIAVSGTTAYIGGAFNSVNGLITRNHLAAFDATTGELKSWNPNINGIPNPPLIPSVHAVTFAANNETIFVGGWFNSVNDTVTRNNLAAFDLIDGTVKDWNPDANGEVRALLISGEKIFAGGDFTTINGGLFSQKGLAAFDIVNGTAIDWNAGLNSSVRALVLARNTIYVGGDFTNFLGNPRNRLAAFDTSGMLTNWNPNANNTVRALRILGNRIFVGGEFTQVNGSETRNNLAAFDTSTGIVTSWNPNPSELVRALSSAGGTLYAGGNFININGIARSRAAAFDAATGALTNWDPNAQNTVYTIFATASKVYAGGAYTNILNSGHSHFAVMDDPYRTELPAAPDAPTAVAASQISETSFNANWGATTGADGYYLDIATDETFTSIVTGYDNKDVGNVTTFSVNANITNNTPYYYRIRAYNLGGNSASSNTISLTTGSAVVKIKVFLQGSYNGSGEMTTLLNTNEYIPLSQPYNTDPWNYTGTEAVGSVPAGVVDWVLVELRTDTNADSTKAKRAGFLKNDGTVIDTNGSSSLTFSGINAGDYYIVVRHRNHLAIMSAAAVALDAVSSLYDFTTAQTQAYGTDPMKDLGSGEYGMYAGDGNSDGQVTGTDFNIFNPLFYGAASGYQITDWNLDGQVTGSDFNIFNVNFYQAKSTKVPE